MASQFKIPKKKQTTDSDSASLVMQSPLSRLQSPAQEFKSYGDRSGRGDADRMHAGSSLGSTDRQSAPIFRDVVKSLLGLNSPSGGASSANHRAAGSLNRQSQKAEASVGVSNGWRPKRASDRLLQPDASSERRSPPQKKKSPSCGSPAVRRISVSSVDSLAALRGDEHDGSLSPSPWRRDEGTSSNRKSSSSPLKQQKKKNSSLSGSEDDFLSPSRPTNKPSSSSSSSSSSSVSTVTPDRRRSLDRKWMPEDWREKERERWREFKARKTTSKSAVLHLRLRRAKPTPSEPIVLSSEEEEEEEEEEGADAGKTTQSCSRLDESLLSDQTQAQQVGRHGDRADELAPPSFLQLQFVSLHAGLTHADANGHVMITENGITLPLKGVEEGEVSVVASQVRGYGVWDGGVARGGTLLAGWEGPAPSLLFLWVTDAQANLLQTELIAMTTPAAAADHDSTFGLHGNHDSTFGLRGNPDSTFGLRGNPDSTFGLHGNHTAAINVLAAAFTDDTCN
ncbi:uncharacterized protein LOC128354579 [Scomber japonicus]|uniref:uncharacterized protein LOC128354579 n=1 Tax=Scomber japonicus TaxID=13676 RepID=UPI0023055593|nr:uncharacterized protein LOC128354579 [Scomber japonicus]